MQSSPDFDSPAIDSVVKTEMDQLATQLRSKYPNLKVVQVYHPIFVPGLYYKTFIPAHLWIQRSLRFYGKGELKA